MSFRLVFVAVFVGTSLVVAAFLLHRARPAVERQQPTAEHVRATGKCAQCHLEETPAVVHQYETSRHAAAGVTCLDCHGPREGQEPREHRGFVIAASLTSHNCRQCHETEYRQYRMSRHAAPAWAAVRGAQDFSPEEIAFAERHHPGAVERPANELALLEGPQAIRLGCMQCHAIGRPNPDGSLGTCTSCHARHASSIELARTPETCGQCHMGPDHSQIEIYHESKHGVLFRAQKDRMDLRVPSDQLTSRHMPVPTCATCHMSGIDGLKVTHDTTERLSWWLFAPVSERRPGYLQGQAQMKEVCLRCHATTSVERYFQEAETALHSANEKVRAADAVLQALRDEGLLTPEPFDETAEFVHFDLWHYYGRTAKHGAFMGGADFVQWHGFYEILLKHTELEHLAEALRREKR